MKAHWTKYTLHFKNPSGTSRGVLHSKDSYFIFLNQDEKTGIGECGLLRGLSIDDRPDYEEKLNWLVENINSLTEETGDALREFPSIQSGLEMALLDMEAQDHLLFPSEFTDGRERQPINGLIWMGDRDYMQKQVREKIDRGFLVIKMKIGALNFEEELALIKSIRQEYSPAELQLRVDANGAFSPADALKKMEALDDLRVHSIEQPIKAGQWQEMARLCEKSPLPVALDEELIGISQRKQREKLLDTIKPKFLILKPSLLGGFKSCEEWIDLAEARSSGWWVTSALESNIGLNAIAQWNFTLFGILASGLGTGGLYTNNFDSPLDIVRGTLAYNPEMPWKLNGLLKSQAS